ncbi:hypothetical protein AAG747_24015 [Rapidithrix thailandica]|uniref:Glycosyltransferase RgtA/B/C/D-like domain-containing protein n=1 Tax=Rapidithrix thailandica TaxID=413964 RepID=A0AAW9S1F2_9BACT
MRQLIKRNFFYLLSAGIGLSLLGYSNWKGLGLTFDSLVYLEGGQYILNHGTSGWFSQLVFQEKPPLFPLLIALFQKDLRLLNLFQFCMYLFVLNWAYHFTQYFLQKPFWQYLCFFHLAISTTFLQFHKFLFTEPLFIVLLYGYLWVSIHILESPLQKRFPLYTYVLTGMILGILLVSLRHIGILITLSSSLFLLWHQRKKPIVWWITGGYLFVPLLFFTTWQYLIWAIGLKANAAVFLQDLDIGFNLKVYSQAIYTWFLPTLPFDWLNYLGFILCFGIICWTLRQVLASSGPSLYKKYFLFLFTCYFIPMSLKGDLLEPDGERYLGIFVLPFWLVFFSEVEKLSAKHKTWKWAGITLMLVWSIYPLARTLKNSMLWHDKIGW